MTWTDDELTRIGTEDELEIASRRDDGTLRWPRTIWATSDTARTTTIQLVPAEEQGT